MKKNNKAGLIFIIVLAIAIIPIIVYLFVTQKNYSTIKSEAQTPAREIIPSQTPEIIKTSYIHNVTPEETEVFNYTGNITYAPDLNNNSGDIYKVKRVTVVTNGGLEFSSEVDANNNYYAMEKARPSELYNKEFPATYYYLETEYLVFAYQINNPKISNNEIVKNFDVSTNRYANLVISGQAFDHAGELLLNTTLTAKYNWDNNGIGKEANTTSDTGGNYLLTLKDFDLFRFKTFTTTFVFTLQTPNYDVWALNGKWSSNSPYGGDPKPIFIVNQDENNNIYLSKEIAIHFFNFYPRPSPELMQETNEQRCLVAENESAPEGYCSPDNKGVGSICQNGKWQPDNKDYPACSASDQSLKPESQCIGHGYYEGLYLFKGGSKEVMCCSREKIAIKRNWRNISGNTGDTIYMCIKRSSN